MNINLLYKGRNVPNGIKTYREFCSIHSLTQIIKDATRITEKTSTLLDHILTNSKEKVSQSGIVDIGLSDHQMIYCTRKLQKEKTNKKTYVKIRSLKHYTKEKFVEKLSKIHFPDYLNTFEDIKTAYSDFLTNWISCLMKLHP